MEPIRKHRQLSSFPSECYLPVILCRGEACRLAFANAGWGSLTESLKLGATSLYPRYQDPRVGFANLLSNFSICSGVAFEKYE